MIKSLDGVDVTVSILSRDAFMQRTRGRMHDADVS